MKLRLNSNNSIRLRLSQSDIRELGNNNLVSVSIGIGKNSLIYTLKRSDKDSIDVEFADGQLVVNVPNAIIDPWISSDRVGFEGTLENEGNRIFILVEKDFQCLIPRKEDEKDLFINPKAQL